MAIEVAPAAVARLAHFFANGGQVDYFAAVLAGYGLLMVTAQLPLLPRYRRLPFSLGTWAFTFSWTAVSGSALFWIAATRFVGDRAAGYLVLAAITGLVGGTAARTVLDARQGRLLPVAATASEPALGVGNTETSWRAVQEGHRHDRVLPSRAGGVRSQRGRRPGPRVGR